MSLVSRCLSLGGVDLSFSLLSFSLVCFSVLCVDVCFSVLCVDVCFSVWYGVALAIFRVPLCDISRMDDCKTGLHALRPLSPMSPRPSLCLPLCLFLCLSRSAHACSVQICGCNASVEWRYALWHVCLCAIFASVSTQCHTPVGGRDVGATYDTLQHTATTCDTLQHTTPHCNAPHPTTTHCTALRHTSTGSSRGVRQRRGRETDITVGMSLSLSQLSSLRYKCVTHLTHMSLCFSRDTCLSLSHALSLCFSRDALHLTHT